MQLTPVKSIHGHINLYLGGVRVAQLHVNHEDGTVAIELPWEPDSRTTADSINAAIGKVHFLLLGYAA